MTKHYTPEELVEGFSQLHTLPEVYLRIKAIADDPKSQANDLVRELSMDPALTARVLRVVNSPLYGMNGKVETLLSAVSVLGTRAIHDLVLATSVTGMLVRRTVGELDLRDHWRLSLTIGLLARAIAQSLRLLDKDRMFVEGLLSRMGEVVIHERIGAVASVVYRHAQTKGLPLHHSQRNFLGCHYGEVGAALLRRWRLPEQLCNGIDRYLEPPQAGEAADIAILRLAANLASSMGERPDEDVLNDIVHTAGLDLNAARLVEIMDTSREELETVLQVVIPAAISAA